MKTNTAGGAPARDLWRKLTVVVLFAGLASCGEARGADPERTVEQFIAAAHGGHAAEVYALLGPRSRKQLDERRQSAKRVSGRLALSPQDFLSVGRAPPAWEPSGARLLRKTDTEAQVQVHSATGDRYVLTLVREGRRWKLELPGT